MLRDRSKSELPFRKLLWLLAMLVLAVIVIHVVAQLSLHRGAPSGPIAIDLANRFSLDAEMSAPTWLASLFGITVGIIGLVIGRTQKTTYKKLSWYVLGALGFLISLDEAAALHELVLQGLHIKAGFGETQTWWQNAWLLILPFVLAGLIITLIYWYRNMPRRTFVRLLGGICVYLLGALVVEYASIQVDKGTRTYTLGYVVAEEGLEYAGIWLMIRACLLHITEYEARLKDKLTRLISS